MPGKRSSTSSRKEQPRKIDSAGQPLSSPQETITKKVKKGHAKESNADSSSSDNRNEERKVLVPKKLNIYEGVKEGKNKSRRSVSTSKTHCELMEDDERKIFKKSKKTKLSGSFKKSCVGGYDADVSLAPDSSPEVKKKTKKLNGAESRTDPITANGDASLNHEDNEEPDDTLNDHGDTFSDLGDTGSEGDCSDDCEEKCPKNNRKPASGDALQYDAFNDDDDEEEDVGDDEQEEDESEVESHAKEMIDNEAEEVDSSEEENLDESNEGYGIYFEAGSTMKGIKAPSTDVSYNSAREEEEMETDADFVVSDTHIEYEEEDDSWLDDDETETKQKKYSRIIPSLGDDSSSEDERECAKLAGRHADEVVEREEASHSSSDSEGEAAAVQQNDREEKDPSPTNAKMDDPAPGQESSKVAKRRTGGKTFQSCASEVSKASVGSGSDHKRKSSAAKMRIPGDTNVPGSESPAPEHARRPLTTVQKLTLLTRCSKDDLLNIAKELIKSERQFVNSV